MSQGKNVAKSEINEFEDKRKRKCTWAWRLKVCRSNSGCVKSHQRKVKFNVEITQRQRRVKEEGRYGYVDEQDKEVVVEEFSGSH
ncbi:hypothetical protein SUGI_0829130 [Cryptomeria japonica]|nr:hypothetical protein SUGI_0829130 [Cryptomeria japonica]